MNWITRHFHLLLSICIMIFAVIQFVQNGILNQKLDATKIQNIHSDSEAKQVKINYLVKDIRNLNDSVKCLAALRKQDSIQAEKYKKEIDRLKIAKHEKYIAIDRMDGHGLYGFFARLDTGSASEK